MNLPPLTDIKATGRPVASYEWTDPRTGKVIQVNDFGRCDGISDVKGFAKILAEQKAQVKAERKLREAAIRELMPEARECARAMHQWSRGLRGAYPSREERTLWVETWWKQKGQPGTWANFQHAFNRC